MKPYSKLAPYYRSVMEHVDYARWGHYLERLLRLHSKFPQSLLEVAGGAGLLTPYFNPKSLKTRVTSDLSLDMISLANPKFAGMRAVADAAKLPFKGTFDMVLMTYDAINYLSKGNLLSFFKEVYRVLSDDGVFVFDAVTEFNSLNYFDDDWDVLEVNGCVINRHSVFDYKKKIQRNAFDFFTPSKDGLYERTSEMHEQFIYPVEVFEKKLAIAKLKLMAVYSEFSFSKDLTDATRLQFIACKESKL